jgi:phage gp29-like protein
MSKKDISSYPHNVGRETYNEMFEAYADSSGVELTATKIHNVLGNAFDGYSQDQASIFRNVKEKEIMIGAHLQTRKLAVSGLPWTVIGKSNAVNQEVSDILDSAGINDLMNHLLEATGYGYSGAFIQWGMGGGRILDFPTIDHANWQFEENGTPLLVDQSGERHRLSEYNKNNIVYHQFNANSGIPSTRGLCRTLIWTYFFKLFAFRNQARYLEKYGIPFILAKLTSKDFADDDTRTEIKTNLRNIGADGIGVFTDGTTLESLNTGTQSSNGDFNKWLSYLDTTMAMLILGQIASTGPAGGLGSDGQVQDNVRRDLLRSDAKGLQETINNQVIRPLEFFKYGTKDLKFIINAEPPSDLKSKQETIVALKNAGYDVEPDWIEETFGIPIIRAEKPVIPPAPILSPEAEAPAELAGIIETEDKPTDAVAFDEEIDLIINQSTIPEDIKSRARGKTAKEALSILNDRLANTTDELLSEASLAIAQTRDAIENNIREAIRKNESEIAQAEPAVEPEAVGEAVAERVTPEAEEFQKEELEKRTEAVESLKDPTTRADRRLEDEFKERLNRERGILNDEEFAKQEAEKLELLKYDEERERINEKLGGAGEFFFKPYEAINNFVLGTTRGLGQLLNYTNSWWMPDNINESISKMVDNPSMMEKAIQISRDARKKRIREGYSNDSLDDALKEAAIGFDITAETMSDMIPNLMALKFVTGSDYAQAGKASAGKISNMLSTLKQALKFGAWRSGSTAGTAEERGRAGALATLYMATPAFSGLFGGLVQDFGKTKVIPEAARMITDALLNLVVTDKARPILDETAESYTEKIVNAMEGAPTVAEGYLRALQAIAPDFLSDTAFALKGQLYSKAPPEVRAQGDAIRKNPAALEKLLEKNPELREQVVKETEAEIPTVRESIVNKADAVDNTIRLELDEAGKIPSAQDVKSTFNEFGYDVNVRKDGNAFKIDVVDKEGAPADAKVVVDAYRSVIGDTVIDRTVTEKVDIAPTEAKVTEVKIDESSPEMKELNQIRKELIDDAKANSDLTAEERDAQVKDIEAEYTQAREDITERQSAPTKDVRPAIEIGESIDTYRTNLKNKLKHYNALPKEKQNKVVKSWLTAEIRDMAEDKVDPQKLLSIETSPKKITMNFGTFITDKFLARFKGEREGRRGAIENIGDVQNALVQYMKEQKMPLTIKGKLLVELKNLSKFAKEETRDEHLKLAIEMVDREIGKHDTRLAKRILEQEVSNINKKLSKLSPELKTLAGKLLDGFDLGTPSAKTREALKATLDYLDSPNKDRAGLLKELKLSEDSARQLLDKNINEKATDRELIDLVSQQRRSRINDSVLEKVKRLEKVAVSDMDVHDIRTITATLQSILKQNDTMTQLRESLEKSRANRGILDITSNASEARNEIEPRFANDPIYTKMKRLPAQVPGTVLNNYRKGLLGPYTIAWFLDGRKDNGPINKHFVEPLKGGSRKAAEVFKEVFLPVKWKLADEKIKTNKFSSRKIKHGGGVYNLDKGEKIELSPDERIAIFLTSRDPDGLRHLMKGGFVFKDDATRDKPYKLTYNDLSKIINDMSEKEVRVAELISAGYNGEKGLGDFMNRTSLKINGHKIADGVNHFPIVTSALHSKYGQTLFSDKVSMGDLKNLNNFLLESQGFTKERKAGASNAIVLRGAIDTFKRSVNDVGRYYGYAEVLRQAKAIANNRGSDGRTVADVLYKRFPKEYWDAIKNLPQDIEQGMRRDITDSMLDLSTRGILGYNIGIMMMQPISYITALNEMPLKHWLKGVPHLAPGKGASYKEMGESSAEMAERGEGKMSIAMGEALNQKISNTGMKGISWADGKAIGAIWRGVESWVREDMPELSGEAFKQEVAKRHERIVERTQPTSDTVDRPLLARSSNIIAKNLMRFSSQTNKNYEINFRNEQEFFHKPLTKASATKFTNHLILNRIIVPTLVSLVRHGRWAILLAIGDIVGIHRKDEESDDGYIMRMFEWIAAGNLANNGRIVARLAGLIEGYRSEDPLSRIEQNAIKLMYDTGKLAGHLSSGEVHRRADEGGPIGSPKWETAAKKLAWDVARASADVGVSGKNITESALTIPAIVNKIPDQKSQWWENAWNKIRGQKKDDERTPEELEMEEMKANLKL